MDNFKLTHYRSLYSIDKDGMPEYLTDMVHAVTKTLAGNKAVALDRERLKKAERVGPSCAERLRIGRSPA